MSARQVALELDPSLFGEREKRVAHSGRLVATAFRYRSGVARPACRERRRHGDFAAFPGPAGVGRGLPRPQPHHEIDVR